MPVIYHVTTATEWKEAQQKGSYMNPSLEAEGFIHCSQDHQVAGVIKRYFSGKSDLLKLVIETEKLTSKFIFVWSKSAADTFPHIYGPINLDAVTAVIPV